MKRKLKRLMAGMLALVLTATGLPVTVEASEAKTKEADPANPIGFAWEDPDYTNVQGVEVYPNTTVEQWKDANASAEVTTRLTGGIQDVYISYNPGTTIATDNSAIVLGREDDADGYNGIIDKKYITLFTPKYETKNKAGEIEYKYPSKITGIEYTVTDRYGTEVDSYNVFEANSDQDGIVDLGRDPGLRVSFAINEPGEYNVKVKFYANFNERDEDYDPANELSKWYECSYDYMYNMEYGYQLNLFGCNKDTSAKTVNVESSNDKYVWDLSSYKPVDRYGYTFEGWSLVQNDDTQIVASKSVAFKTALGKGEEFVLGDEARTDLDVYAIFKAVPKKDHVLTYDLNGGTWKDGEEPTTNVVSSINETETMAVSQNSPTREGYKFLGWNTAADAMKATITGGDAVDVTTAGLTIYAVWEKIVEKDSVYFINIWGVCADDTEFDFEGPTEANKVTITVDRKDVTTTINSAVTSFDSKTIDKYFGAHGCAYTTTVSGSLNDHENRVYAEGDTYELSWPIDDGGTVNIVYTFVGFDCTANYYPVRGEDKITKTDTIYSAVTISEMPIDGPTVDDRYGYTFKGWNLTGELADGVMDTIPIASVNSVNLYGVWEPVKGTYVVKHRYHVVNPDGTLTLEGEVVDEPGEGNVGQQLVYNGTGHDQVSIKPVLEKEFDNGSHFYTVEKYPENAILIKEEEQVEYVIDYTRTPCVGSVRIRVHRAVNNEDGEAIVSDNNEFIVDFTEGTTVEVDKETGKYKINGKVDDTRDPIDLKGSYKGKDIEYKITEADKAVKVEHTNRYEYSITLSYTYVEPKPETITVTVHQEYYLEKDGNLTKEGELDQDVKDVKVGSVFNKEACDKAIDPVKACMFTANGISRLYTEFERSADVTVTADGKVTYTIKYKRKTGVKYTIAHEYYINNEGGTYVRETVVNEEGEGEPGQHICTYSSVPGCIIVTPKLTIELNGRPATYTFASADPEAAIAEDGSTVYHIRYERQYDPGQIKQAGYTVNHEYYIADSSGNLTKEGVLSETGTANVGTKIGATSDGTAGFVVLPQKTTYTLNGMTYTYTKYSEDPVAVLTEAGTTYTIKYMRQSGADATRLGQYVVNHDLYKKDSNGAWALERRVTEDAKFGSVGSVVGVKTGSNNVTIDIAKMTFKETEGTKTKEYQFQSASDPQTLSADNTVTVTLSYYYTEYDTVQATPTPAPPTGSSNNTVAPTPTPTPKPEDGAPKTGDDFKMSAMMPLSGIVSLICVGGLIGTKKKKDEDQ